ncbi:hypothetical protein GCM10010372_04570 [Streptomyces tauricus]|nr:hypothetical protein GCM10010372_04570 [Streptomyces tauricus]
MLDVGAVAVVVAEGGYGVREGGRAVDQGAVQVEESEAHTRDPIWVATCTDHPPGAGQPLSPATAMTMTNRLDRRAAAKRREALGGLARHSLSGRRCRSAESRTVGP